MTSTESSIFDETVQLSDAWLKDLMLSVDWDDNRRAYRLLRATLHALRDRLPHHETVHLGAQLPMLIRGLYYEGWRMGDDLHRERSKSTFLSHVEAAFERDPNEDPEALVRAVFELLSRRLSSGEISHIKGVLSAELRDLWPPDIAPIGAASSASDSAAARSRPASAKRKAILRNLEPDQARFIALLAKSAREERDSILGHPSERALDASAIARGEHNPTAALGFDPLSDEQLSALRTAIDDLTAAARIELYALMRIGQGHLAVADWDRGISEARALQGGVAAAALIENPDLHLHLSKALYEAGMAP